MYNDDDTTMRTRNGFKAVLNMPPAWEGGPGLPPYAQQPAYKVADHPACPEDWQRVSGEDTAAYFVAVKEGRGLWLDFNQSARWQNPTTGSSHYTAVLIAVQELNPVTGKQVVEPFVLEQYKNSCPLHDVPFESRDGKQRFCVTCKHHWREQNYLSSNAFPERFFWLDGFQDGKGVTRQWMFTSKKEEGVAARLIGEQRSYSVTLRFFPSIQTAPPPAPVYRGSPVQAKSLGGRYRGGAVRAKSFEVGMGEEIRQEFYADPFPVTAWGPCAGTIVVHYVDASTRDAILAADRPRETSPFSGLKPMGGGSPHKTF